MTFDDDTTLVPLTGAHIRALYERNRAPEVYTLVWEVWRLQRRIGALDQGLEAERRLRRGELLEELQSLQALLASQWCVIGEEVEPGKSRREHQTPRR